MAKRGWTLWTLHQHFKEIIKEERRAVRTALDASDRALEVAKTAADKAMQKADKTAGDAVKDIAALAARITILEGESSGFNSAWGYLVGFVGVVAATWALFRK